MGTNYYHVPDPCPTCGHGEEMHIGKSSGGWCFLLHVYPEYGINDLGDWEAIWSIGQIRNEYGDTISPEDMKKTITERTWTGPQMSRSEMASNYATEGPNGLLRHRLMHGVVKHGEGTWDCSTNDFS